MSITKQLKDSVFNKTSIKDRIIFLIPRVFVRTVKKLLRSWDYAKFGYSNNDWDFTYFYSVLGFKLKRVKTCLNKGYAIQEEHNMLALDEAITICDRLEHESHEDKYNDAHDLKWGEPEFSFTPTFISTRKNATTEEEKQQELKERLANYDKAEQDRKTDIDRLAEILKVNGPTFWD